MFDPNFFAQKLKKYRSERGITQSELAELLGVTAQSVSKWERGESLPDLIHLSELAGILRVSADVLLHKNGAAERTYIAIDSGLKTEFVLINEKGRMLNRVVLGESKPEKFGVEAAFAVVRQGIDMLRPEEMNVQGIFFQGGSFDGEELRLLLKREYPNIRVGCDKSMLSTVANSSQPDCCLAVSSGGSCVVYGNDHGITQKTGGAGYLFQRSGSAYDIGRDALAAALADRDGTGEPTVLTRMVEDVLGGNVWKRLDRLYLEDPTYIASFAPVVSRACREGDAVAQEILEQNSEHLARIIHAARKKTPAARHVVLTGSAFTTDDTYYEILVRRLDPDLIVERITWPTIWSACLQCVKMCGLAKPPSVELFMQSREHM